MTLLVQTDGLTCDVNPLEVEALLPAPANYLPVGIPAAAIVRVGDKPDIIVQGTVAAVAALLAVPSGSTASGEFLFRPTAVDNPALGIFGSWASLVAATAALAAAGVPFVVNIDLSLLGASFAVPVATNFGGQCTLRGIPSAFTLQATSVFTLSGIVEIDDLTIEAPALGGATGVLVMPLGASQLRLRGTAQLLSSNAAGPVLRVPINDTLTLEMHDSSSLALGANAAIECDGPAATLNVILVDNAVMQSGCIADGAAPGSALILVKASPSARLPATLAGVVGYNAGGVTTTATLSASEPVVHGGQYGAAAFAIAAGTYFLAFGGNSAIALAGVGDSPLREPQNGGRPRVLVGAILFADADGVAGPGTSTVELLIGGVPVPGMALTAAGVVLCSTAPVQLTPTQGGVVLATGDVVSARFTWGVGGITATPVNPRVLLLVG